MKNFHPLAKSLVTLLYPPKCALCGKIGVENLCEPCEKELKSLFQPKKFLASGGNGFADNMFTLFPYSQPPVKKLIFDWKRVDYEDLHHIFRKYMEKAVKRDLLPTPIHKISYLPRRPFARSANGFDQAEKIAEELGKVLDIPVEPLLRRRGYSKAQRKAPFRDREKNVKGKFVATKELHGETVLLVDDIITTGETAKEGARILKKAGAMKVYIFSLAH